MVWGNKSFTIKIAPQAVLRFKVVPYFEHDILWNILNADIESCDKMTLYPRYSIIFSENMSPKKEGGYTHHQNEYPITAGSYPLVGDIKYLMDAFEHPAQ